MLRLITLRSFLAAHELAKSVAGSITYEPHTFSEVALTPYHHRNERIRGITAQFIHTVTSWLSSLHSLSTHPHRAKDKSQRDSPASDSRHIIQKKEGHVMNASQSYASTRSCVAAVPSSSGKGWPGVNLHTQSYSRPFKHCATSGCFTMPSLTQSHLRMGQVCNYSRYAKHNRDAFYG